MGNEEANVAALYLLDKDLGKRFGEVCLTYNATTTMLK
jgi:hypothetical protein